MEFWAAAALSVGTTVVGGYLSSRSSRKGQEDAQQHDAAMARERGFQDRETLAYQGQLADHYGQLGTQRRRNARGAMFDKYSKIATPANFSRPALVGEAPKPPANNAPPVTSIAKPRGG